MLLVLRALSRIATIARGDRATSPPCLLLLDVVGEFTQCLGQKIVRGWGLAWYYSAYRLTLSPLMERLFLDSCSHDVLSLSAKGAN